MVRSQEGPQISNMHLLDCAQCKNHGLESCWSHQHRQVYWYLHAWLQPEQLLIHIRYQCTVGKQIPQTYDYYYWNMKFSGTYKVSIWSYLGIKCFFISLNCAKELLVPMNITSFVRFTTTYHIMENYRIHFTYHQTSTLSALLMQNNCNNPSFTDR